MTEPMAVRIRRAVRACMNRGLLDPNSKRRSGVQATLARHFGVSRQRISQVVAMERRERRAG